MQTKIIWPLSLILFFRVTNSGADFAHDIKGLNQAVKAVGQEKECDSCAAQQTYSAGLDSTTKMQDCVKSVCTKTTYSSAEVVRRAYAKAASPNPAFDKRMQPLIEKASRAGIQEGIASAQAKLNYLKNPVKVDDPSAQRIFNFFSIGKDFSRFKVDIDDDGQSTINVELSRGAFPELNAEQYKSLAAASQKFLELYLKSGDFESDDPNQLKLTYTEESMRKKTNEVIANLIQQKSSLLKDPNFKSIRDVPNISRSIDERRLSGYFKDDPFDAEGLSNLSGTSRGFKLMYLSASDPDFKAKLDSMKVDPRKFAADHGLEQVLKDQIDKRKSAMSSPSGVQSSKCRYAYELAHQLLPSEEKLASAKPAIGQMQNDFAIRTKNLVCAEKSDDYQKQVLAWEPKMPQTIEQFDRAMEQDLARTVTSELGSMGDTRKIMSSPSRDSLLMVAIPNIDSDDVALTSAVDDACKDITPKIFPDMTMYSTNNFVVGPSVLGDPERNKGITLHELGHKLWGYFANKNTCPGAFDWFLKARECLRKNHAELSAAGLQSQAGRVAQYKPSLYEEEDWADVISAKTDDKANNFACVFLNGLAADDYANLSLSNADATDPHSSNLFRVLHTTFLKTGTVPPICEEALHEKGEKTAFKKCL